MLEQAVRPRLATPQAAPDSPGARPAKRRVLLEKPPSEVQLKAGCAECEEEEEKRWHRSPKLERPSTQVQAKPRDRDANNGATGRLAAPKDRAERQADEIGERIAEDLALVTPIGPGRLSPSAARIAERHLGVPVDSAELHVGGEAERQAQSARAKAITEGSSIKFRTSAFAPSTSAGRRLIGHELTHVAQQAAMATRIAQGDNGSGGAGPGEGKGTEGTGGHRGSGGAPERSEEKRPANQEPVESDSEPVWFSSTRTVLEAIGVSIGQLRDARNEKARQRDAFLAQMPARWIPPSKDTTRANEEQEKVKQAEQDQVKMAETALREMLTLRIGVQADALDRLERENPRASQADQTTAVARLVAKLVRQQREDQKERQQIQSRLDLQSTTARLARIPEELAAKRKELANKTLTPAERAEAQAAISALQSEERELDKKKADLSKSLGRVPPGTAGNKNGICYVVYENEVRTGGDPAWRFNNPTSTGPYHGKPEYRPSGYMGVTKPVRGCNQVDFFIYSGPGYAKQETRRWMGTFLLQGGSARNFVYAQTTDPGERANFVMILTGKGINVDAKLSRDPRSSSYIDRVLNAIEEGESSTARPGTTYTCSETSAAAKPFQELLGCSNSENANAER